jgi:hypothetical protein
MENRPPRPTGVTILGIFAILIGLFGIFGGIVLLTSSDIVIVSLSAFAVLVGILYLAVGIGFFRGDGWAWILGIIVSIIALVRNVIEAVTTSVIFALPGIIFALIIIYYLTRPHVKAYFGKNPKMASPATGTPTGVPSPTGIS